MALEKCPVCSASVKQENLRDHYTRVHPKRLGTLPRSQTLQTPRIRRGKSHRKILLALLVVVLLTGATVYALRPGGQSQEEPPPPPSAAPLTVGTSPSALEISGPGIVAFDVTLTPIGSLSSNVVLAVQDKPPGVRVNFEPSTLSLTQDPGTSRATVIVGQAFAPGQYQIRVMATVGSGVAESAVALQINDASPSKHFYLLANSTGWNSTEASGPNPPIVVQKGETFDLTLELVSAADFHHYISIYPSGTATSQVSEYSSLTYARSDLAHEYPGTVAITFTSEIAGTLEYYCDTHALEMHGTITVTA